MIKNVYDEFVTSMSRVGDFVFYHENFPSTIMIIYVTD